MTFNDLRTEIMDRLNLSSTEASTRVGRAINRKYRLITSAIGLQLSRRTTVNTTASIGFSSITWANVEKVINVYNRTTTPYRRLKEVTLDELREEQPFGSNDSPTKYAIESHTSDSVTIAINRIAQTAFTLYADVHQVVADLSGSNEPAFPESYHDVIIEGVMSDELRKMEKPALAKTAQAEYERILSDLRMWIAKSNYLDIYQGKLNDDSLRRGTVTGSGGGSSANGALSYEQTGLITFNRDPSAPFAVTSGSAKVDNLNADLLDGFTEAEFAKLADNETVAGDWTINGQTVVNGSLLLPVSSAPAQTSDRSIVWDSDDNLLTVGTGSGRKIMVDTDSTQTLTGKSIVATQLTGTVADARLSSNVPLKDATNAFTGSNSFATNPVSLLVGQILFPATQNASTNANTLDDYEEGTWTPNDGSGAALTFTGVVGRYIKIGKMVHIWLDITYPATADGTAAKIGNLPFTCDSSMIGGLSVGFNNTATAVAQAFVRNNTVLIELYSGAGAARTNANLTTSNLIISGSYVASA